MRTAPTRLSETRRRAGRARRHGIALRARVSLVCCWRRCSASSVCRSATFPLLAVASSRCTTSFPTGMTLREAVPGAVFAGGGWTLLGTGFNVYAAQADSYQVYGVIGGVLLLVTWFYFAGQVLLVGAAVNAALADRQLQQVSRRRSGKAMSEDADETDTPPPAGTGPTGRDTDTLTDEELQELREEFESFREDIEGRTLHRDEVRSDLKQYVRRRMRRGHARQWGSYIVLLTARHEPCALFSKRKATDNC